MLHRQLHDFQKVNTEHKNGNRQFHMRSNSTKTFFIYFGNIKVTDPSGPGFKMGHGDGDKF